MNVFETVKNNVTVRQAAEYYGFQPDRSGLIRCIFHDDRRPSMKVDRRYYCFGCGCTGDVIDFTAQLFGVETKEAALKLAEDFGISYDNRKINSKVKRKTLPVMKRRQECEDIQKAECARYVRAFLDYRSLLLDWKKRYAPKSEEEDWDEHFLTALKELSIVEYKLDVLLFGEEWEKEALIKEKREEVEKIESICRKAGRQERTGCCISNGTDGGKGCDQGNQVMFRNDTERHSQRNDAELHDCSAE